MRVSAAKTYFGDKILNNILNISVTTTQEQSVTPSIQALCDLNHSGITWWAPIPDTRYKSQDGRSLNLEVICSMIVSD